jgi:hypothetical protein
LFETGASRLARLGPFLLGHIISSHNPKFQVLYYYLDNILT